MRIILKFKQLAFTSLLIAASAGAGCIDEGPTDDEVAVEADKRGLDEDYMAKYFPTAERRVDVLKDFGSVQFDASVPVWQGDYDLAYADDVSEAVAGATQDSFYWIADANKPSRNYKKKEWVALLKGNWAIATSIWPNPQHEVYDATTNTTYSISDLQEAAMAAMLNRTHSISGSQTGKTHPAAMFIALGNRVGMAEKKSPVVVQYSYDGSGERQIVTGYETTVEPISGEQANHCIGRTNGVPGYGSALNVDALYLAHTKLSLVRYTGEHVELRLNYILEAKDGAVVGGEWCKLPGQPESIYMRLVVGGSAWLGEDLPYLRQRAIVYLASLVAL